ncbi:MAG: bifunctional oligoribonuclease/PAP phosphatase NrnA [Candidatus Schekmanbacteria bacterium]|nr:MAG: bifunctional oligoribonuclease/PAP phosphatase NrnA [Candidatus Schekmanbacteria bacterium]
MKTLKNNFRKVEKLLEKCSTAIISTHRNPDADAIGSELAFYYLLKKKGIDAEIVNFSPLPENLRFLPDSDRIKQQKRIHNKYDIAIILDCESPERNGYVIKKDKIKYPILYIDHHKTNPNDPENNIINPLASSTSEIIYYLVKHLKVDIDEKIATCLFTGIFFDTGGLRYSNASKSTFKVCYELVKKGISVREISKNIFENRRINSQHLLAIALSRLKTTVNKKVCWTYLTVKDFNKTNADNNDTEGFIDRINETEGIDVSIFFKEIAENMTKVSLRSNDKYDVSEVAIHFGGGGHKNASGFIYNESLKNTIKLVLNEICKDA